MESLRIETLGTEEEAGEGLDELLDMGVEGEAEGDDKEGGEGILRELGTLEFLTQEAEPSRTMLIDARNGSNKMR